jgi:hypothetical protein
MTWRQPHSSGNPNRVTRRAKRAKRIIAWKDPETEYGLTRRERPARYHDPGTFMPSYKVRLVIGALMAASIDLERIDPESKSYPFPTLRGCTRKGREAVPTGTLLIYAGTVRVVERARVARQRVDIEVPKHTFIVPNVGRCIIHDLRLVKHA